MEIDLFERRLTYWVEVRDINTNLPAENHGLPMGGTIKGNSFDTTVLPRLKGDGNLLARIRTNYRNSLPAFATAVTDLDTDD